MSNWGLEEIFKLDLNSDGLIGDQLPENPAPSNDGAASFAIEGTPQLGQVLSIALTNSDPDGDGTPTVAWLASNQDGTWSQVGSDPQITISADLEGRQLIANVSYIDGDGFSESVSTPLLIPVTPVNDGAAALHNWDRFSPLLSQTVILMVMALQPLHGLHPTRMEPGLKSAPIHRSPSPLI